MRLLLFRILTAFEIVSYIPRICKLQKIITSTFILEDRMCHFAECQIGLRPFISQPDDMLHR